MAKIAVTQYRDLTRWDVKTYLHTLRSHYPIVSLAPYLIENRNRVKPFDYPKQEFDILGVTNKNGIYFNETLLGSQINQPYYQVDAGDIFYNPYRVNVGSVGIVPKEFHHKYTSPAYVVFKTKSDELLSEYLLIIMKSDWFNDSLRAFTSGSVRQNLTFSLLGELKIPLPPLSEQQKIVDLWNTAQSESQKCIQQAQNLKQDIDDYLMSQLGITVQKQEKAKIFTTRFKDLERWDVGYNTFPVYKFNNYELKNINQILKFENRDWKSKYSGQLLFSYIQISDVEKEKGIFNHTELKIEDAPSRAKTLVKTGDLLISLTRPNLGAFAIISENYNNFVATSGFLVCNGENIITNYYIMFLLQSSFGINLFNKHMTGALYPAISQEDLGNIKIPLPPMEKQEEIVQHISELRSQISELTKKAQHLIESTRETIKNMIIS
ncbi:MAG: restriction endonuclease subunit S [Brevinema sp.]